MPPIVGQMVDYWPSDDDVALGVASGTKLAGLVQAVSPSNSVDLYVHFTPAIGIQFRNNVSPGASNATISGPGVWTIQA